MAAGDPALSLETLVVGGGVAGLTLALGLARAGLGAACLVLEKRGSEAALCADVGGGYGLTERTVRAFVDLGLERDLGEFTAVKTFSMIDPRAARRADGGIVRTLSTEGGPRALCATRGKMQQMLTRVLREEHPELSVRYGERVVRIDQDAEGVTVTTASGLVVCARCVIGADGIWSTVRSLVFQSDRQDRSSSTLAAAPTTTTLVGRIVRKLSRQRVAKDRADCRSDVPAMEGDHPSSGSKQPRFAVAPESKLERAVFRIPATGEGAICFWGKVDVATLLGADAGLENLIARDSLYHALGGGCAMFTTCMSDRILWALFVHASDPGACGESDARDAALAGMHGSGWLEASLPVRVVAHTPRENVTRHPIWDLEPSADAADTVNGRVGLIGDAAHAMCPFLGMGACSAIGDGFTVAGLLASAHGEGDDGVAKALAAYAAARCRGNARNVRRSRQLMGFTLRASPILETAFGVFRRFAPIALVERETRIADDHNEFAEADRGGHRWLGG